MEFTGERVVPGNVDNNLLNEHLCRYRFAELLVKDKVVLDIGSGVGYGAKILAEKAREVIAIDLSEEAIRYADREYSGENVEMMVANGENLPLASDSVDVVVSFELIEHLHAQQVHLLEVERVLKPDGIMVISTPNRIFYSQESNQNNPFHTHEFNFPEFLAFLNSVFGSVEIYFQNHIAGLIIGNPSLSLETITCLQAGLDDLGSTSNFFVAVCTQDSSYQPRLGNFCLLPSSGNLLSKRQKDIQRLEKEVQRLDSVLTRFQTQYEERTGWALQLNRQVKRRDKALVHLRNEFDDRTRWALELSCQLKARNEAEIRLRSEFEDRTAWALQLNKELEDRTAWALRLNKELQEIRLQLESIMQSRLYKLARLLGLKF